MNAYLKKCLRWVEGPYKGTCRFCGAPNADESRFCPQLAPRAAARQAKALAQAGASLYSARAARGSLFEGWVFGDTKAGVALCPEHRGLPADPDGQNDDRAEWGRLAVDRFAEATGSEPGDALADLLCDLMHLADRMREADPEADSFEDALDRARSHYDAETEPAGGL